jgi:hypothetical protein
MAQHPAVGRDNVEARVGGVAVHGEQRGGTIALLNRQVDLVAVRCNRGVRRGALPPTEQLDAEKALGARDQFGDADSAELDAAPFAPFPTAGSGAAGSKSCTVKVSTPLKAAGADSRSILGYVGDSAFLRYGG